MHGGLRPVVDGDVTPAGAGCAVVFRVRYPRAWWVIAVVLFVSLVAESVASRAAIREFLVLVLALAILVTVAFAGPSWKGASFARRLIN